MDAADLLRRAYDREAPTYDARFAAQQHEKYAALAAHVPPPEPRSLVVDAGGGTGMLRHALVAHSERWAHATFVVVDLSHAMLVKAQALKTMAIQADARRLPLKTASAACVVSVTGIVDPSHLARALVSSVRVCRPGGLIAFSLLSETWNGMTNERLPLDPIVQIPVGGDVLRVWRRR